MAVCFAMTHINKRIPGPLVGIFLCTVIEHGLLRGADIGRTNTVEDTASVSGNFPIPMWADSDIELPKITWAFIKDVRLTSSFAHSFHSTNTYLLTRTNDMIKRRRYFPRASFWL